MIKDNLSQSPAYKIFHIYIECRVQAAFVNQAQSEIMGDMVYIDKNVEKLAANELIHRRHTTNELIEYYRRGATIVLEYPDDAKIIYKWLMSHLHDIRNELNKPFGTLRVPIEDIEIMDEFAKDIYRIAKIDNSEDVDMTEVSLMLRSKFKFRSFSSIEETKTDKKEVIEHESISDIISKEALLRGLTIGKK